jgi:hypothetical protein
LGWGPERGGERWEAREGGRGREGEGERENVMQGLHEELHVEPLPVRVQLCQIGVGKDL